MTKEKLKQLALFGLAGIIIGVTLGRASEVQAHHFKCFWNCYPQQSASPSPTPSPLTKIEGINKLYDAN